MKSFANWPKESDFTKDDGVRYPDREWKPSDPLPMGKEDDLKEWFEMADKIKRAKEANIPISLGMIEELPDPAVCECGELFYVSDDYMCHRCREAFDAQV